MLYNLVQYFVFLAVLWVAALKLWDPTKLPIAERAGAWRTLKILMFIGAAALTYLF